MKCAGGNVYLLFASVVLGITETRIKAACDNLDFNSL